MQDESDEYATLAQLDAIAAQASGPVERVVVRGRGHVLHAGDTSDVVERIGSFVRRLG